MIPFGEFDEDAAFVANMPPPQLRRIIALASGLLADHQGENAPETLRRIAMALEDIGQVRGNA